MEAYQKYASGIKGKNWIEGTKEYRSQMRFAFNLKNSLFIGVIGLIAYIITIVLTKIGIACGDIEKYSTIALSLGFFISIFSGLFGLIFEEGSKGDL